LSKVIFDFTAENFAVTGASSGIGREVAISLAKSGAKILAIGRNLERLAAVKNFFPDKIITASVDVCDEENFEKVLKNFVQENGKFKGGVHAAGITDITPLRRGNTETARQIMETSFWAGMNFLRLMTKNSYAEKNTSTVLFSSVEAFSHEKGMFAYVAAKAALEAGLKTAAKEIASKGHRVNSIVPGFVESEMMNQVNEFSDVENFLSKHLLGAGKPENISDAVLFLLSDSSSWMTGSSLIVDGGYLA